MKIVNIHERELQANLKQVGVLIDSLASREDNLWPKHSWPSMKFDRTLGVGASGGHGPVRYFVAEYATSDAIKFKFIDPKGFNGFHGYERIETSANTVILRHSLEMTTHGLAVLTWPLIFRPLHDALIEDSLATAAVALGHEHRIHPWSRWVRFLRWMISRGEAGAQIIPKQRMQMPTAREHI